MTLTSEEVREYEAARKAIEIVKKVMRQDIMVTSPEYAYLHRVLDHLRNHQQQLFDEIKGF